jgi:hypothetical protein
MLDPATPFICTVRHYPRRTLMLFRIDSLSIEVSGHGVQIKDRDGNESDGLDECLLLCLLLGIPVLMKWNITRHLRHGLPRRRSIPGLQHLWSDCRRCKLHERLHICLLIRALGSLRPCMSSW